MIPLQKPVARNQTDAWVRYTGFRGGLPHSEICGSKVVRTSPQLIAAYHVLHRLLPPRHPRNALKSLDCSHYQCPLGSGIIDHKKTRSCEIDPITARLSAVASCEATPGRASGISLLHDGKIRHSTGVHSTARETGSRTLCG